MATLGQRKATMDHGKVIFGQDEAACCVAKDTLGPGNATFCTEQGFFWCGLAYAWPGQAYPWTGQSYFWTGQRYFWAERCYV